MTGYLSSFKFRYPVPSYSFLLEIEPYLKENPLDTTAELLLVAIVNDYHITKPMFWSVRKRIAEYRDRKRCEWACNPNTETYKCS
jgi:hypothetical protein